MKPSLSIGQLRFVDDQPGIRRCSLHGFGIWSNGTTTGSKSGSKIFSARYAVVSVPGIAISCP